MMEAGALSIMANLLSKQAEVEEIQKGSLRDIQSILNSDGLSPSFKMRAIQVSLDHCGMMISQSFIGRTESGKWGENSFNGPKLP